MKPLMRFLWDSEGTTAVEYAVMLALILVTIIGTIGVVGARTGGMWGGIDSQMETHNF